MKIRSLTAIAALTASAHAQRDLPANAIPKPDPAAQMETFILDENLEINLFAADPMIAKPISMNWDSQGRLWVVSSHLYPQIKPGQRSDDQVVVLEDTNNDGKADKSTVFAQDLLIPTGIMPGDGGVYVANSTEILHIKDNDGDLKEDERQVLLSGFGTEDTHHIIHAFRGGPDGMLYFNQSIYIHSHVETPHGVRRLMAGGIWHLRPESLELEVFARGFVNSWGHAFDRYGQSFATDGAHSDGINYVFPGSVFVTAYNSKRNISGLNSGQPKHCGLEIINSSHFPDDWQGTMIANDFRGHRVNRFVVTESESGYVSRQAADLIKTSHGAFRPIDAKIGPDGALYITDWYNPIIQHGEVDFRDPRRDHTHGRIWRVTYKGRPLSKKPDVHKQAIKKVVAQLQSPDGMTRYFAKRELRNREKGAALAAVGQLLADPKNKASSTDKLEALWAHQSLNHLHEPLLRELLQDADHRIRAAAVRVLYHWHARVADALALLEKAVTDEHPRVRLEAVNALRQVGGKEAFVLAMKALEKPIDKNLDFALWTTTRELQGDWMPALEAGEMIFSSKGLQFALTASERPEAIRFLYEGFRAAVARGEDVTRMVDLFADVGGPEALDLVYAQALAKQDDQMLARLFQAQVARKVKPSDLRPADLLPLVEKGLPHAILLGGAWRVEAARPLIVKRLTDRAASSEHAVAALTHLGDSAAGKALGEIADDTEWPATLRAAAVAGLVQIDAAQGLRASVKWLGTAKQAAGSDVVLRAYLVRKDGPGQLAKALDGKEIAAAVATAGVRQAATSGGDTKALVAALTMAGGLAPITAGLSGDAMLTFVKDVQTHGDAKRGEAIYRRSKLLCQTCHAIGGGGGTIGPDLLSIGASAPIDYITDSLLEPGKKIKEGYHTTVLTTKDGKITTGGVIRDADDEIVLRLADGSHKTIAANTIAKKEIVPVSLMPPGLTATLRKDELLDLVRFMSELGKEGGYKVPSKRLVRRWRVLPADKNIDDKLRSIGSTALLGDAASLPWNPAYSTVSGELPLSELGVNNDRSFAQFEIEVTVAGEIGFRFDNPQGLQVIFGKAAVAAKKELKMNFATGRHPIVILVDRKSRTAPGLKVELFDVEGSPARAAAVGGL
ncbi:MAG: putative heme-binding domain-containing protein [Hyphomicrobiaceae bacterium]|jgi:putative heme-binding domain-containing protein